MDWGEVCTLPPFLQTLMHAGFINRLQLLERQRVQKQRDDKDTKVVTWRKEDKTRIETKRHPRHS